MNKIRTSASRIELLHLCSYLFYLREVEDLPEPEHPKATVGRLVHKILQCLRNPRHKNCYDNIEVHGSIKGCLSIIRLIKTWRIKYNINEILLEDVNDMVMLGLKFDFFFEGAKRIFKPEHDFLIKLNNYEIRGFIDDLAEYEDYFVIRDYKTKSKRFGVDELEENFQASVYQLYVWETFHKPAIVNFIMLRHPPTKRTPDKTIQRVKEKSKEELNGFKVYLNYIGETFKNFGYHEAVSGFCKNIGFCDYVCNFKNPFDYQVLLDSDGKIIRIVRMDEKLEAREGQIVEKRHYIGCAKWYGNNL